MASPGCEFPNGTISASRAEITRLGIPSFAKCAKERNSFFVSIHRDHYRYANG
jgi:hypothetical protein